MIAYNAKDAKAAFTALADVLDATAKIDLFPEGEITEAVIASILDADPELGTIRKPLENAIEAANMAGDTDTETKLKNAQKRLVRLYGAVAETADNEGKRHVAENYATTLGRIAAYFRKFGRQGMSSNGKPTPPRKLSGDERTKLLNLWQKFKRGKADYEKKDGEFRMLKRSFQEFWDDHETTIIHKDSYGKLWSLKQFFKNVENFKKEMETLGKAKRRTKQANKEKRTKK